MLQINHLTINHLKDLRALIHDLSFTLNPGDKAAIIGEEGNGKSTLLKLIYEENSVQEYVEFTGQIIRNGKRLGYLAQELNAKEKEKTIYEFCGESELFYDCSPKELSAIAAQLGLATDIFYSDRSMGSLSGGEKVKLQLARILMDKSDVLLLDEPSNDIDISTLEWLEHFIVQTSVPILYISHDEILLENTANMIIHLELVKRKTEPKATVVRTGYTDYVTSRLYGLERQEQIARNERNEFVKQQEKLRKIQQKVEHQQNAISRQDPHGGRLLKKKMHTVKSMQNRFEKQFQNFTEIPDTEEAIFIRFDDSSKIPNGKTVLSYDAQSLAIGDRVLSTDIKLEIIGTKKVCIIGKNGVGKSTLLKDIAKMMLPRMDIKAFYMPQNYEDLLDMRQTPIEFLTVGGDKDENVRICTYLGSMKYTADEMHHRIMDLSGGQKAKLLLLKMSMQKCNVLILDEPTRNFSPLSNPIIRQLLIDFEGTIISVSHDRKYIREVCTDVYELSREGLVKVLV